GFDLTAANVGSQFSQSVAIPDDPTITQDDLSNGQFLIRSNFDFTVVSTTFLGTGVQSGVTSSPDEKVIEIVIDGAGGAADQADLAVFFGGHLALSSQYNGLGASTISGGPFHMRVQGEELATEKTFTSGDRNIKSGAILPPENPDLHLTKTVDNDHPNVGDNV